jgi:hypothetical protein
VTPHGGCWVGDPLQGHLHTEDVAEGQRCSSRGSVVALHGECWVRGLLSEHLHTEDVAEGQRRSLKGPVVVLRGECQVCDLLLEHPHTEDVTEGQYHKHGPLSFVRKVLQPVNAPEPSMGRLRTEDAAGVLHLCSRH